MKQNGVVCQPGPALLFFIFRFEYLILGPKSYQDFRETGPRPLGTNNESCFGAEAVARGLWPQINQPPCPDCQPCIQFCFYILISRDVWLQNLYIQRSQHQEGTQYYLCVEWHGPLHSRVFTISCSYSFVRLPYYLINVQFKYNFC